MVGGKVSREVGREVGGESVRSITVLRWVGRLEGRWGRWCKES